MPCQLSGLYRDALGPQALSFGQAFVPVFAFPPKRVKSVILCVCGTTTTVCVVLLQLCVWSYYNCVCGTTTTVCVVLPIYSNTWQILQNQKTAEQRRRVKG